MSTQEHTALVQQFCTEVFAKGDPAAIDALTTADFVDRTTPAWALAGRDGLRQHVAFVRALLGAYQFTVEELIADEQNVVVFWTLHGTHHGAFAGFAPTGKPLDASIVSVVRIRDGRVA